MVEGRRPRDRTSRRAGTRRRGVGQPQEGGRREQEAVAVPVAQAQGVLQRGDTVFHLLEVVVGDAEPEARRGAGQGVAALAEGDQGAGEDLHGGFGLGGQEVARAELQPDEGFEPGVARPTRNLLPLGCCPLRRVQVAQEAVGAGEAPHGLGAGAAHAVAVADGDGGLVGGDGLLVGVRD